MEPQLDFTQKRKNLFDCLDNAEKSLVGTSLQQQSSVKVQDFSAQDRLKPSNKRLKPEVRTFRKKESIFKRPELPITKCLPVRHVPDYQKNPQKWKKYSLEGVDISDNANTSAAFAFLKEIDARKGDNEERIVELPSKIEFKKSTMFTANRSKGEEDDETTSMRGTKVVMPEYCVGQKLNKKHKKPPPSTKKPSNTKALKLNHLFEEEENEHDDE